MKLPFRKIEKTVVGAVESVVNRRFSQAPGPIHRALCGGCPRVVVNRPLRPLASPAHPARLSTARRFPQLFGPNGLSGLSS